MADPSIGKPQAGNQLRADDYFVVPMCSQHHRDQHQHAGGERQFWDGHGVDVIKVALRLYAGREHPYWENAARQLIENIKRRK